MLLCTSGCGNGKYMSLNKSISIIGCDMSIELLKICQSRGHNVVVGDATNIPLKSNYFSYAICIAVLHHISSVERRLMLLSELLRIVKIGGQCLITAW